MNPEIDSYKGIALSLDILNNSSIVSIVKNVESSLKLRIYSHKYSIVSYLYDNPDATSLDIQNNCPSSNSTFYKCLAELRDSKIIRPLRSTSDMRTRRYYLSEHVNLLLEKRHKAIGEFFSKKLTFEREDRSSIVRLVKSIESEIGFNYYTSEFQIIIFLYENEVCTSSQILSSVSTSEASFYSTLKRLIEEKIIMIDFIDANKRQKSYRLSENVEFVLDSAHRLLVASDLL